MESKQIDFLFCFITVRIIIWPRVCYLRSTASDADESFMMVTYHIHLLQWGKRYRLGERASNSGLILLFEIMLPNLWTMVSDIVTALLSLKTSVAITIIVRGIFFMGVCVYANRKICNELKFLQNKSFDGDIKFTRVEIATEKIFIELKTSNYLLQKYVAA